MTVDEFNTLRTLTDKKRQAIQDWENEVRYLRAQGYSTRSLADAAGVSHMTVWELGK